MSVLPLLARLEELDINIGLAGGQLRIDAPRGKLTPGLIKELKDRKQELIGFLQEHVRTQESYASIESMEKREYYPLSSAQKRLYIVHQLDNRGTGYNIPLALQLAGGVDKTRLEETFKRLVQRHESLRTSFEVVEEEPVQRIHEDAAFGMEHGAWGPRDFVKPFDLSRAPLLRVGLIKTAEEKHILILDMHHIITDGLSVGIFVKEFITLYRGNELPALRIQYKDFALRQNREHVKSREDYWLKEFSSEIPVLELPVDFTRPKIQNFEGSRLRVKLGEEETGQLKAFASAADVTLFMVLLSIYYVLLAKLSGQEDIVVGTPVGGRRHADLNPIIGMFVNTLPLRNYPLGGKTFNTFLQEVKTRTLEAFENREYPFEELVERLAVKRDMGRNPLYDVVFALQTVEIYGAAVLDNPEMEIPGLRVKPYEFEIRTAKFDMNFTVLESKAGGLLLSVEYCTALFKQETIERFIGYFKNLVSFVLHAPGTGIEEIEIISREETRRLLYEFNDTGSEYPKDKTIRQLFREQAAQTPDHIAVVGHSTTHRTHRTYMTYTELYRISGQLAYLLRTKGVEPDTIIGLMVERSIEMIVGILGILKAGGAYLPIELDFPEERIKFMLADSGAKVLLTNLPEGRLLFNCQLSIVNCQLLMSLPGAALHHSSFIDHHSDLAYVIYTSGTTGKPRGVMTAHYNVTRVVKNTNYIDLKKEDRVLQLSNYAFDGSVFDIYGALLNGALLVLVDREQVLAVDRLAALIKREQVTVFFVTTALFNTLVDLQIDCFANIRKVLFGGERVSVEHAGKALQYMGEGRIIHVYGPTETTVYATYYFIDTIEENAVTIPIGKPISNTTLYILDKHLKPVPTGVGGEIYIGGAGTARGYLNNPELTAEKFNRSYKSYRTYISYKTGDLARWLPDPAARGAYIIEFMGRIDHQVKLRGFRIELGEIESQLLKHNQINEAVVLLKEDKQGIRQYLCAYFTSDSEAAVPVSELRGYLSKPLPGYMIPSYFVQLDKMPLTPNGKIDRGKLPGPEITPGDRYEPPRDKIEQKLAEIWAEVLGTDYREIGINDDFFELGGHSLKATYLAGRMQKTFNVKIPLTAIFETPTIRELAAYLSSAAPDPAAYEALEPFEKKEYYPLSATQQRIYMLQQMNPRMTAYHIPSANVLAGEVDTVKLEESFLKLIHRHESLRTSFTIIDAGPVQQIHDNVEFSMERGAGSMEHGAGSMGDFSSLTARFIRPFDLSRPPLLRVNLIKIEDDKHVLLFDMHHIISDGTSMDIFTREFPAFYAGEELPGLRIQYKDFSQWQNHLMQSEEMKKHEAYWLRRFKGKLPLLDLKTDYPRPEIRSVEGDCIRFKLERELSAEIRQFLLETGTTLYMLLLAALNVLLYRYTGQEDIIIGSPIAGRNHADLENIVGLIMGSVMMRHFPRENKTFHGFLAEVKQTTLQAYEHQLYPFEEMLKKVEHEFQPGRNPFSDVALIVQNLDLGARRMHVRPAHSLQSITAAPFEDFSFHTAKLDLTLVAVEEGEDICLNLEYCTKLFKRETMERLLGHFENILKSGVGSPGTHLSEIELMGPEEKKRLIGASGRCYRLSHPQKRIYYTEKKYAGSPAATLAFTVRYAEVLDMELLEEAINRVIQQNEALRLWVVEVDFESEPLQYVSPFQRRTLDFFDFSNKDNEGEHHLEKWIEENSTRPFDWLNNDLFYFARLKFSEKETGYYVKVHHIIADGWTVYAIFQQINKFYKDLEAGRPFKEEGYPSYIRYLSDEREYLESSRAREDREFWRRMLLPLPSEVRLSSKKGNLFNIKAGTGKFFISPDLQEDIYKYCKDQKYKTSIYKLFFSILSVYISRVTGFDDFVIGSVNHNRATDSHKRMAGMFVSTIPLRVKADVNLTFRDFVERNGTVIDTIAKKHQRYPFDLTAVEIREETGTDPEYLLNINLIGHGSYEEKKYKWEFCFSGYEQTHITIHIDHWPSFGILELEWDYQLELFSESDIFQMHRSLINLLTDALHHPDRKLADLEILSPGEKKQILQDFNAAETLYPRDKTLHELFCRQAAGTPDRAAVVGSGLSHRTHRTYRTYITYDQLNKKSDQLGQLLMDRGVGPDGIVGLLVEPSVEMIIGILGILKAGGAYLPIDPGYPGERITYLLKDSGAKVLLTNLPEGHLLFNCQLSIVNCQLLMRNPAARSRGFQPAASSSNLAYVIYTSGSTGRPKGVTVEHRSVIAYLAAFDGEFHIGPEDTVLQQASYTFDAFVEEMYPVLLKGGKLAIAAPLVVRDIRRLSLFIGKHQVTMITCSPLLLNELNKVDPDTSGRWSIHTFINGGDVLRAGYVDRLMRLGKVYNTYGPTESTVCATYYRCREVSEANVPIGKPISNYKVYILDKAQRLLPPGIPGELCIAGPGVARGYLNNPELTGAKFIFLFNRSDRSEESDRSDRSDRSDCSDRSDQPYNLKKLYKTGDLAQWLPGGNIAFIGRLDSQVKIRGFRIELGEIEDRLRRHDEIKEVVVVAGEKEHEDRLLCAYIVSGREFEASELREYLSAALPGYMIPSYFMRVAEIPLTAGGKVDRQKLPVPEIQVSRQYEAPGTEMEKLVANTWKEVLNLEKVGMNDNFFDVGGSSISVLRLNSKLNQLLNKDIPVALMFEHLTIRSFVDYLNREEKGESVSVEETDRKDLQNKGKIKKAMQKAKRKGGRQNVRA